MEMYEKVMESCASVKRKKYILERLYGKDHV